MKEKKLYKRQQVKELEIKVNKIVIDLIKKFTDLKLQNKATNDQYMEFLGCTQNIHKSIDDLIIFMYENSDQ